MGGGPRVLVATSINPQIVGGRLFLNATSGTHIYFDKETTARETYFYRLVAQDTRLPSAAPLLKSYAKVESLSIAELNEFVISASSREIDFICTGRSLVSSWTRDCATFLAPTAPKAPTHCLSFHLAALYRVEMSIVVCFNGVMTKLHNMRAYETGHLLAGDGVNPEDTQAPPFVAGMDGRPTHSRLRSGSDDDNGNNNSGAISVRSKVETGGSSQVQGSSEVKKKARKA
ncbi:hypothetical protein YC2023_041514 [Brassica napus]